MTRGAIQSNRVDERGNRYDAQNPRADECGNRKLPQRERPNSEIRNVSCHCRPARVPDRVEKAVSTNSENLSCAIVVTY
jgi:hypothetical protein